MPDLKKYWQEIRAIEHSLAGDVWLMSLENRARGQVAGSMLLGEAIIYAVGVPYLAYAADMSASAAIAAGLTPFLIGDALKAALAMGVTPTAWKLVNKR